MGLERRAKSENDGPCFSFQLHRCKGACVGQESIEQHRTRLTELLAPFALPPWPYAGAIALVERNAERHQEQFHVFDRWCWVGTVRNLDAAQEMTRIAVRSFEPDAARLAVQALGVEPRWTLEVVTLEEAGADRSSDPIVTGATD
jgi:DNA polymerase-3 subunit epsilon